MAWGSNVSKWDFGKDYVDPNLLYKIGSDIRTREYQQKVSDAMRGVSKNYNNMTSDELKARLAELKKERGALMTEQGAAIDPETGYELQPTPKAEGEFDEYKDPNATTAGDVMKNIGKGAGMVLGAPFYGAYKGIEYLYNKIKEGTATPEEVEEYKKLKAEEDQGVPVFGGVSEPRPRGAEGGYRGTIDTSNRMYNVNEGPDYGPVNPPRADIFGAKREQPFRFDPMPVEEEVSPFVRPDLFTSNNPTPAYLRRTGRF